MDARMGREMKETRPPPIKLRHRGSKNPPSPRTSSRRHCAHSSCAGPAVTHRASQQVLSPLHSCICLLSRPYHSHRNRRKAVLNLLRSERWSLSQEGRSAISGPSGPPFQDHPDAGPTSAGAKVSCALKPRSSSCPSRTVPGRRCGPAGHQPPRANTVGPHPQMAGGRGGVPSALHDAAGHGLQR